MFFTSPSIEDIQLACTVQVLCNIDNNSLCGLQVKVKQNCNGSIDIKLHLGLQGLCDTCMKSVVWDALYIAICGRIISSSHMTSLQWLVILNLVYQTYVIWNNLYLLSFFKDGCSIPAILLKQINLQCTKIIPFANS